MTVVPLVPGPIPAVADIAGQSVTLHHGNVAGECAALRSGAMLVDRSERGRMRFTGARAAELLGGLVTNDVKLLAPGQGQYAAALTPKGRIVADPRIFATADGLLVDVPVRARAGWSALVRKYINPRLAPYRDVSEELRQLGAFGGAARSVLAAALELSAEVLGNLAPLASLEARPDGHPVLVVRSPALGVEGYELFLAAEAAGELWRRLRRSGATPAGLLAWEIARVEAGRPEWGLEMDETTIPQEANFDELHAISYTKGCYVGQEVVARVHFRGHVNRHLRGLLMGEPDPPPQHAVIVDDAGRQVGEVRSSVISPRLGAIAIAMVRREVAPDATVTVQWDGREVRADVVALPFPR